MVGGQGLGSFLSSPQGAWGQPSSAFCAALNPPPGPGRGRGLGSPVALGGEPSFQPHSDPEVEHRPRGLSRFGSATAGSLSLSPPPKAHTAAGPAGDPSAEVPGQSGAGRWGRARAEGRWFSGEMAALATPTRRSSRALPSGSSRLVLDPPLDFACCRAAPASPPVPASRGPRPARPHPPQLAVLLHPDRCDARSYPGKTFG